jgi:hypothetical protein
VTSLYQVPDPVDNLPVLQDTEATAFDELPETMWNLPAAIADESMRDLHAQLIRGLRRDAAHLPTGTLQSMQLERIAYYYILIRYRDHTNTWSSPRDRLSTYKLWRDLSSDFNSVAYGNKISPEDLHAIVASHTAKLVASVLRTMPHTEARPLYAKFAAALDSAPSSGQ